MNLTFGPLMDMYVYNDSNIVSFEELRRATLPIFYDMMKVEFAENHDFKKVNER